MDSPNTLPDQTLQSPPYAPFRPFLYRVFFIVCVVVLVWLVYQAQHAILLTFAGLVLAVVLGGLARKLQSCLPFADNPKAYGASLTVVTLLIILMLAGLGLLIGPQAVRDIKKLDAQLPEALENLENFPIIGEALENNGEGLSSDQIQNLSTQISSTVVSIASATVSVVSGVILIPFIALFTAAQPDLYRSGAASLFPPALREKAGETLNACARALWEWLIGQGVAMLIIAIMATAGLFLLDVKYALTLGLIAGISQFVPYLGPIVSTIPALLVAMADSPEMVFWVLLLYLFIQFIEGNFVTPIVMKQRVDLPPVITLVATVGFTLVFGILGAIVATPLTVILFVLYHRLYQREMLGVESEAPGDAPA